MSNNCWIPRPDLESELDDSLMARLRVAGKPVVKTCKYHVDDVRVHIVQVECRNIVMQESLSASEVSIFKSEFHAEKSAAERTFRLMLKRIEQAN